MGLFTGDHVSYSALSLFEQCPYAFYMEKIDDTPKIKKDNAFAQYGSLMHSIIERWAKGKLKTNEQMLAAWQNEYEQNVTEDYPALIGGKDHEEKLYQQAEEYLKNFDRFDGYKVLSVEEYFETDIAGMKFIGFIDMLLEDKNTGDLILLDHKSKSLSAYKSAAKKMYRQLYLYCKYIQEKYGKFPKVLRFNLFREQTYQERKFDKKKYDESLAWAEDIIEKIDEFDFIDYLDMKKDTFFCENLCNVRHICGGAS